MSQLCVGVEWSKALEVCFLGDRGAFWLLVRGEVVHEARRVDNVEAQVSAEVHRLCTHVLQQL